MTKYEELAPQDAPAPEKTKEELLLELQELVNNDPGAPYLADRRMSLFFQVKELIRFGGHFPLGVAYYAIGVMGAVVFLCSGYAEDPSRKFVWVFIGSSLVAQVIEAVGKERGRPGNSS